MADKIKNIIIVGTSGAARESLMGLKMMNGFGVDFTFKGFLSFNNYLGDLKNLSHMLLGDDSTYKYDDNDYVVLGLGSPSKRREIFTHLKAKGVKFFNVIHNRAQIAEGVKIGEGNIIGNDSFLSCDAEIGDGNFLNGNILVAHDVKIGNFNFFAPNTHLLGNVSVGDANTFGTFSVALPNAKIGDENIISPGTYLYKGCKNKSYYAGNPALKVGDVE